MQIKHRWWIAGAGAAALTLVVSAGAVMAQTPSGSDTPTADETPAASTTPPATAPRTPDTGGPTVQPDGAHRPGGCGRKGVALMELATFLDTDEATLRTELQVEGATLATVATAHGQSREALVAFVTEQFQTHLDEKVAAGDLTQAEADEHRAAFTASVDEMIDATGGFRFGGRHGGMRGGPAPDSPPPSSESSS